MRPAMSKGLIALWSAFAFGALVGAASVAAVSLIADPPSWRVDLIL